MNVRPKPGQTNLLKSILVTTAREGFHFWPEAPEEVAFLRFPHRHMFKICINIPVGHNDRQREFFIERRALDRVLDDYDFTNAGSCEMIGEYILRRLAHVAWAEVWEDGENGARVERPKKES